MIKPPREGVTASVLAVAVPLLLGAYLLVLTATAVERALQRPEPIQLTGTSALDGPAGLLLLVAGTLAVAMGRAAVGIAAMAAAGAWLAARVILPEPDAAPWLTAVAAPMVLPLLAQLVVRWPGAEIGTPTRRLIDLLTLGAVALSVARLASFDPFFEPACSTTCARLMPAIDLGASGTNELRRGVQLWNVLTGSVLAVSSAAALVRHGSARAAERAILGGAVGAGLAGGGGATLVILRPLVLPAGYDPGSIVSLGGLGLAVAASAMALAVGWSLVDSIRARSRFRALVEALATAGPSGTIEAQLRSGLGDDRLRVGYPLTTDGGAVRADGLPFEPPPDSDTRTTLVERHGQSLAVIVHRVDLELPILVGELTPSMLVALDNERLAAMNRAQLQALQASAAALLSIADRERRRLERDLHDGAQQRLLALSFELRLASALAQRAGDSARAATLAGAEAVAMEALEALRQVAYGVHPAVLSQAGLVPALESLARTAAIAVELDVALPVRPAPPDEAIMYRVAFEVLGDAVRRGATRLGLRVEPDDGAIWLTAIDDGGPSDGTLQRIRDCVAAAGGTVALGSPRPDGPPRLIVAVPCA